MQNNKYQKRSAYLGDKMESNWEWCLSETDEQLKDTVYTVVIVNRPHKKAKTNSELILLTGVVCVASLTWYILSLCATERRCFPKTIKVTPLSHAAAPGDMFVN